jgi:signal transduction histidine kinase
VNAPGQPSLDGQRQAAERLPRLLAMTAALADALTREQVAHAVVEQGVAALGAHAGALALLADDAATLEVVRALGYLRDLLETYRSFPLSAPLPLARAVRDGEPVWLSSAAERAAHFPEMSAHFPGLDDAWAALPLIIHGRPVGAFGLSFDGPREFTQADRAFMRALAQQCAQALHRAQLCTAEREARLAAERAAQRQALLAEAARAFIEAGPDTRGVLNAVTVRLAEVLGDTCAIALLAEDGQQLEVAALHGRDPEAAEFARATLAARPLRIGEGIPGTVVQTGQPALVPLVDVQHSLLTLPPEYREAFERVGVRSVVAAPLRTRSKVLGVATMTRKAGSPAFDAEDLALLVDLADRAGLVIERAQLYEQAQAAVRLRDEFLSVAAHELKTPLTAILGYSELITQGRLTVDTAAGANGLVAIHRQGLRLRRLVEELLAVSRLDLGRLQLQRRRLDLCPLAEQVVREAQALSARHRLVLDCPDEVWVVADGYRIEQVLLNLLSNAIKYAPQGGDITVRVAARADEAQVSVQDHGIGIPADRQASLFQRFYRAHAGTAEDRSGMGLGLYLSREFVERHGGRVWLESVEGQGSTFSFSLPLAGEDDDA